MLIHRRGAGTGGSVPVFDSATVAWVAAVVANGGTVSGPRETLVDTLIAGLKSDGVWTKLDRLWLLAASNEPSALTDLVGLTLAVSNGSPTFVADRGYSGVDGSTTVYIATDFNPATAPSPQYSLNSAHASVWSNTSTIGTPSNGPAMGAVGGGGSMLLQYEYADGSFYTKNNTNTYAPVAVANALGHVVTSRTGASVETMYKNGGSVSTPNNAAVAVPTVTFNILGINLGGSPDQGDSHQTSMASIGGGLSGTDVSNLYNRLRTYMTAVGVS